MPTTRHKVSVYLDDEENQALNHMAALEGSGVSALLRRLVREYARERGHVFAGERVREKKKGSDMNTRA